MAVMGRCQQPVTRWWQFYIHTMENTVTLRAPNEGTQALLVFFSIQPSSQTLKQFHHVCHGDKRWEYSLRKKKKHTILFETVLCLLCFLVERSGQESRRWHPCGVAPTQSFTPSSCIHELDSCTALCVEICVSSATVAHMEIYLPNGSVPKNTHIQ